ncbi:hypothetical protein Baya_3113 [Bagarius yarrelli]|uniref:Uncharacterized protein n=1 Tax=Bagarius yarrelli TaxID=175774 RepID=A0A556TUI1_BAGYA|nr:hypothetical protein Baya_3113 [Bagarius yarrelli]
MARHRGGARKETKGSSNKVKRQIFRKRPALLYVRQRFRAQGANKGLSKSARGFSYTREEKRREEKRREEKRREERREEKKKKKGKEERKKKRREEKKEGKEEKKKEKEDEKKEEKESFISGFLILSQEGGCKRVDDVLQTQQIQDDTKKPTAIQDTAVVHASTSACERKSEIN